MKTLTLPNGATYGYDSNNQKVCTGSQMGRRNILPPDVSKPIKLQMVKLEWLDGAYDKWGAYWGMGTPIYCAFQWQGYEKDNNVTTLDFDCCVFVRSANRRLAKIAVRKLLPNAKFFN